MKPVRVIFGTPADASLTNAQCINGREIGSRLPAERFTLTYFFWNEPDPRLVARGNVRLLPFGRHGNALRLVREVLRRQDVFFNIGCGPAESILRPLLRRNLGPASVFQVETRLPIPEWIGAPEAYRHGMEAWIRQATLVTGVSTPIVQYLAETSGRTDTVRIPVGIDTRSAARGHDRQGARPVVLTVGALKPGKRPESVIDAARRFPDADFRMIGDGPLRSRLDERISRDDLRNVTLLGPRPHTEVIEAMAEADVFLFPSVHEGQPRVVLEAAAAGLPVVCRDDYGPEGVLHGRSGFAVGDDEALFSSLGRLLSSPTLRSEMGREAREHAAAFDWGCIVPRWAEIFERLAP